MNSSNSLEITKGMFKAVEKTHRALLEECAETIKNLFGNKDYIFFKRNKGCVFIEHKYHSWEHTDDYDYFYLVWIESLNDYKNFDTWLEMVEWIARFEILMRKF